MFYYYVQITAFSLDIFSHGCWVDLKNLQDPELVRLCDALQASLLKSKADSTSEKYAGAFRRWKAWCNSKTDVRPFPACPEQLCLYLQHLKESSGSKAAILEAVNAVAWTHRLAGLPSVSEHPLVVTTLAAMQRSLAKPTKKKEPVTPELLRQIVDSTNNPHH